MNLALIGYGRMGHEIESAALQRGHKIKLIIDKENQGDLNQMNLKGIDAAIEFSSPDAAFGNIVACLGNKVPVVSGTTGWLDNYDKAADLCRKNSTSFIHSSNFSIGVNLIFKMNADLARLIGKYKNYKVAIEEIHHTKKLDAPSGTALTLVDGIVRNNSGYDGWAFEDEATDGKIPVKSVREGDVPGTHIISWDSEIDTITLRHDARNRKGFALGAVIAAEFIASKEGIYTMKDVMGF
jgi:4-hydroxy-tetrahydrodipicolinate reductase